MNAKPDPVASTGAGEGTSWCDSCKSYHPIPRDAAHKAELQCSAPATVAEGESQVKDDLTDEEVDRFLQAREHEPVDRAQLARVRQRFNEKVAMKTYTPPTAGAEEIVARQVGDCVIYEAKDGPVSTPVQPPAAPQEPTRLTPWISADDRMWERYANATVVECPDCCFRFDAFHQDGDTNGYSCPNCHGKPPHASAKRAVELLRSCISNAVGGWANAHPEINKRLDFKVLDELVSNIIDELPNFPPTEATQVAKDCADLAAANRWALSEIERLTTELTEARANAIRECVNAVKAEVGGYCSTKDGSAAKAEIVTTLESLTKTEGNDGPTAKGGDAP